MFDYFTEHIVRKQKTAIDFIIVLFALFGGVMTTFFSIAFGLIALPLIGQIAAAAVVAMWWGIYFLITSRNIEYEYILTNGELDVDKIIGKRKRKRLMSIKAKEVEILTPEEEYRGNADEVIDVSNGNPNSKKFALVALKDCKRIKILFNPTAKMLKIYKVFCQRKVNWSEEE